MCEREPAATGRWGDVIWAIDASGSAPARDFFLKLGDKDAAKVEALFKLLAEYGRIVNREKFKKLDDRQGQALWEFKSFQLRFLGGFAPGRQFLVAVGLRKKRHDHRPRDLDRAARILGEHLSRQAGGSRR